MKIENIDGIEYIKKSEVEGIIRDRISKIATRAKTAEDELLAMQEKAQDWEKRATTADLLATQLEEMNQKLKASESKYSRHTAISKHGITDPDLVDLFEWQYDKSQKGLPQKEQSTLSDWLEAQLKAPEMAPAALKPHLPTVDTFKQEKPSEEQPGPVLETPPPELPNNNGGALSTPGATSSVFDLTKDPVLYRENREKIRNAFYNQSKRHPRG